MTAGYGKITGQQMMGLNCTACHVGELHYNGRAFRMDGGPSMAYINAFVKGIVDETVATAGSLQRRLRFLNRWRRVQLVPLPDYPVVQQASAGPAPAFTDETLDAGEPGPFRRVLSGLRMAIANRSLLMDKLHGFSAVKLVVQAQPLGTEDGYGRNDAFGVGRNELFGAYKDANFTQGINVLPADAPVSFPHLWGMERTSWFQWGVNTNSVIERNIGQALGVGATMEPDKGFSSTVRVDNLHAMEKLQYKLSSPVWPAELFGPIDRARADAGQEDLRSHVRALPRDLRQVGVAQRIPVVRPRGRRHRSERGDQLRAHGDDRRGAEAVRNRGVRDRQESEGGLLRRAQHPA